jgi:nicotinamide mononucleotide (NMN) deamidase PncC
MELVAKIHSGDYQLALAVTGGGASAVARLLSVPGGSRTLLEAVVPYAGEALSRWLGGVPDQFCSARTARAMAMQAFCKVRDIADPTRPLLGVGCTASLVSAQPKKGPHRIHVATQSLSQTCEFTRTLAKGERSRADEEHLAGELVLLAILQAVEPGSADLPSDVVVHEQTAPLEWQELLYGTRRVVPCCASINDKASPLAVLPGAFNPLHGGHRTMARYAAQKLGAGVTYELSVTNVDKPPLDYLEIAQRLAHFDQNEHVVLTAATTFVKKAPIFPGATFIIGLDTLTRIGDVRYYADSESARDAALEQIASRGCQFLVFGRRVDGTFHSADEIELPPALRQLCTFVPESEFREDVSSTELRQRSKSEFDT